MSEKTVSEFMDRQRVLLENIRNNLPVLKELLEEVSSNWDYEDPVYRFYHQSFKVYSLQAQTQKIVSELRKLTPSGEKLCGEFETIISEGASGKKFEPSHNEDWLKHTRPFLEAFFHARFFLEMAVKYGQELSEPVRLLPSGWAALLSLYNLR